MVYLEKLKKIKPEVLEEKIPDRPLFRGFICFLIVALFCVSIFGLFFTSLFDTDKTVSESENRMLASFPKPSVKTVFDGSFMTGFETYYADTFPHREEFLRAHQKLSAALSGVRGSDDVVLVGKSDKDDFAGQDIDYEE